MDKYRTAVKPNERRYEGACRRYEGFRRQEEYSERRDMKMFLDKVGVQRGVDV